MKKPLILSIAGIILITLAGCSSSNSSGFNNTLSKQEIIEMEVVKPPNLIINGDTAYYSDDSELFKRKIEIDTSTFIDSQYVKVESQPEPLRIIVPKCPSEAIRTKQNGTTRVKIMIDKNGNPKKAIIFETSGKVFNETSLIAAMQCKFSPAIMKNHPVAVWVVIPFRFMNCY